MRDRMLHYIVMLVVLLNIYGCGDTLLETDMGVGLTQTPNQPSINPNMINTQVIGALVDVSNRSQTCSVALIDPLHILSAAHCFNPSSPVSNYRVVMESPVTPAQSGIEIISIIRHPLWSGSVTYIDQHIQSIQEGQISPLHTKVWYDIAVARLAQPLNTGSILTLGDLPIAGVPNVDVTYYAQGINGTERLTGLLSIAHTNQSSFTAISTAPITSSGGGGSALISTTNSGGVLVGILSATSSGLGALFTRVGVHRRFIDDAVRGMVTGNYIVNQSSDPNNPNDPNDPNDPIDPNDPNTFDCAIESDGFCDISCRNDIDCETTNSMNMNMGAPLGAPCNQGEDCHSRLCLQVNDVRSMCSEYCPGSIQCPVAFQCVMSVNGNEVCAPEVRNNMPSEDDPPELLYFGADCNNDAQCLSRACISHGGRKWCSELCTNSESCSIGYSCVSVGNRKACVPPQ